MPNMAQAALRTTCNPEVLDDFPGHEANANRNEPILAPEEGEKK